MALIITSNPGNFYSAQGDLIFSVFEATKVADPVTYPDYKYVMDVYVNSELILRLKKVPHPVSKFGLFNIGDVVRNYLAFNFSPAALSLQAQQSGSTEFFIGVTVKFGEEYGFTLYTNVTVDSERFYYNHYNGRMIGLNTILESYKDKALTVRPYSTPVNENDKFQFIPFFATDSDNITLVIKSYAIGGVLLDTITEIKTPSSALQLFNVAPAVLNGITPGFIDDSVSYYTVEFQTPNIVNPADYSKFKFTVCCEPRYEQFTIHFMNRFGAMESKTFDKVSRKTIDIIKTDFGKLPYTINPSGVPTYWNENKVYNETRSTYASQFKEKMILNSDLLTDTEYQWLGDLIISPLTYIQMGDYFIGCSITDNNYEYKKIINDDLTNLTIDIEFGDQFNAQFR